MHDRPPSPNDAEPPSLASADNRVSLRVLRQPSQYLVYRLQGHGIEPTSGPLLAEDGREAGDHLVGDARGRFFEESAVARR